ncbi:FixH family protein [Labrenzia sp. 011]|uniref:FixH family protein n=1 Tax=Labrenzia sp. 011 TaxID=2171494 RepID=UPI000D525324|nr:FixH family protein [Labrenzia sp. 011]PVB62882.1 nitrogen fixation protein FixH [Labrenzia sp. 011]
MAMVQSGMKDPKAITGRTVLVWLLSFFGVVFAANAAFIYLALGSYPGVVEERPYEAGQTYNEELAAARMQADLDWQVSGEVIQDAEGTGRLVVTAADADGNPLYGVEVRALLRRPVMATGDIESFLKADGGGRYTADLEKVPPGNWTLVLEIEQDGVRKFKSENRIFLKE